MIHVDFKGCSLDEIVEVLSFTISLEKVSCCSGWLSRFSLGVFGGAESDIPLGVLGAPKDANAPEPRPNADEALVDGEDRPPDRGDNALNGFDRP